MTKWQKRIRELEAKGVTQAKIAREVKCTRGAISLLATGKRRDPTYRIGNRIMELCDLVGIDVR